MVASHDMAVQTKKHPKENLEKTKKQQKNKKTIFQDFWKLKPQKSKNLEKSKKLKKNTIFPRTLGS